MNSHGSTRHDSSTGGVTSERSKFKGHYLENIVRMFLYLIQKILFSLISRSFQIDLFSPLHINPNLFKYLFRPFYFPHGRLVSTHIHRTHLAMFRPNHPKQRPIELHVTLFLIIYVFMTDGQLNLWVVYSIVSLVCVIWSIFQKVIANLMVKCRDLVARWKLQFVTTPIKSYSQVKLNSVAI